LSTITLLEVFKQISQLRDEPTALQYVAVMKQGRVVDLDVALALRAARAAPQAAAGPQHH
jgi:hypothetical protein